MDPSGGVLSRLGLRSYVSQSALAQVLSDVRRDGIPEASSRSSIKRAREASIRVSTPFGPLLRSFEVHLAGSPQPHSISYVHPIALLHHLCERSNDFAEFVEDALQRRPPSLSRKWEVVVYCDEVVPGNQLEHDNRRKGQAIYWSFKDFGGPALGCEHLWFVLGIVRSNIVNRIAGGMSALMRMLLLTFFDQEANIYYGVPVQTRSSVHMLCAKIGCVIGDHDALKQTFQNKGASGTLFCMCCRNVVAHRQGTEAFDPTGFLVAGTTVDYSKFKLHTDRSLLGLVQHLASQRNVLGSGAFKALQQSLGFNYCPEGVLLCPTLGTILQPISSLMYDFMHTYFVNGIFNLEVGILLNLLRRHRVCNTTVVHNFFQTCVWPSRLASRAASGKNIFHKRSAAASELKCSASEGLSVYCVLRLFLMVIVLPTAPPEEVRAACGCYFKLCAVIDILLRTARGGVKATDLHAAIADHLRTFLQTHGDADWLPKCHFAMHLASQLRHHGFLLSCWVHERKHKEIKRYANEVCNCNRSFEGSVTESVLAVQIEALSQRCNLPSSSVHLVTPLPAPTNLARVVRDVLQLDDTYIVRTSTSAQYALMQRCAKGDLAVAMLDGTLSVCQVWFHAEVADECISCVSVWPSLGNNMFQVRSVPTLIPTRDIVDTCVYRLDGDTAQVAPFACIAP
jgi:hypothetical protein